MTTVNMHEAKTHLSRLVDKAAKGEPFVIAKAGKPLVKVVAIDDAKSLRKSWLGCLEGQFKVPHNFKDIGREEIEEMFGLND